MIITYMPTHPTSVGIFSFKSPLNSIGAVPPSAPKYNSPNLGILYSFRFHEVQVWGNNIVKWDVYKCQKVKKPTFNIILSPGTVWLRTGPGCFNTCFKSGKELWQRIAINVQVLKYCTFLIQSGIWVGKQ